jgi:hypothetical protein
MEEQGQMAYDILLMGASYGSLLASKLLSAVIRYTSSACPLKLN